MVRTIGAILAGIAAGFVVVVAFESLGPVVVPEMAQMSPEQLTDAKSLLANHPQLGAIVLLGFMLGAMVCVGVASLIAAPVHRLRLALSLGGLHFLLDISNFFLIEHPIWMIVATLPMAPLGAYLGYRLVQAIAPPPPEGASPSN